ncbi:unnamed protein product [Darwinula stevensoni]|uniref:Uncharacterized protein n=1 Tax=Darwinula stevensoni TaxID=69355 RepID=A0A7R8XG12_9CRUS|nr:unnamed protein product [Darwinula stevensoni]CAG0891052.1 unnamed protein product [Darwinula stevensoni]
MHKFRGEGGASTWMHAGNAEHSKNDQDQSRKLSRTRTGEEDLSTLSDTEVTQFCDKEDLRHVETSSVGGSSANSENVGRVGSWALSFERLLDDTAGIHTFAEFLKKEFSHENIYFWAAVQRYKNHPLSVRGKLAQEIYDRHISVNASEPVNVDSQARQTVQERLRSASPTLFQKAEDQIFKLMKFDSYPRFLKSPLYKEALMAEVAGYSLPYPGGDILESDLQVFEADEVLATPNSSKHVGRRRSLLAWGRRARAKSRDRGRGSENHGPRASSLKRFRGRDRSRETNSSTASSTAANEAGSQSSKTSLTASDLGILSKNFSTSKESLQSDRGENSRLLCRVILPDQSTTVVSVVPGETVRSLVHRLLERRGLKYSAVDVFTLNSSMALDQLLDCASLACQDIRVEARVLIQVDLPSGGKSMSLKAAPGRRLAEVLRPVLANLGLKVDQLVAYKLGDKEPLSMKTLATNLDSQRVILKQKDGATGLGKAQGTQRPPGVMLDEITNKVFLDLMRSKSVTDADRVPTDESSSQSSGIVGSLVRRNSIHIDRDLQKNGIQSPIYEVPSPKPNFPSPTSETLYEDLKKAQKLRLEDQRGTTINCQLPEFLKSPGQSRSHNKENREIGQMMPGGMAPSYSRFSSLSASIMTVDDTLPYVDMSFSHDGILPTHAQAENYFGLNQAKHVIAQAFQGQHKSCSMSPFPPQDGDVSLSPLHIPTPNTSVSSLHVEEANFTPPSPLVVNPKPLFRNAPPPPLPPKPKTCPPRGPPPRPPPSRPTPQLNLYEINLNGSSFPQCQDLPTGNVSFV